MRRVIVVFILLCSISACKKTPVTPTSTTVHSCAGGTLTGFMTATIDGTSFVATCLANLTVLQGLVSFGATDVKQNNLGGFIDVALGVQTQKTGTFQFGPGSVNNAAVTIGGSHIWQAGGTSGGTGTVTFTTFTSTEIAGTFSLDLVAGPGGTGTKTLRDGKFDMSF